MAAAPPTPAHQGRDELRGRAAARLRRVLGIARMKGKRGMLVVLSGPSGVGKDTIIERLLELEPNLRYSVSHTTRAPRPGEVEGVNYTFTTRKQFEQLARNGH